MKSEATSKIHPSSFWDERYSSYVTVYGEHPNLFFEESLKKMKPGKLLLPGEGEGRNAVFAAIRGWQVDAFDYSHEARKKALSLAAQSGVKVHYTTADITEIVLPDETYDVAGLIYFHLPPETRTAFHHRIAASLKKGGHIIIEAFSKAQINNISGGPRDERLLYDLKELTTDFEGFHFDISSNERIRLNEGPFHQGKADVIRILATKPA